MLKIFLINLMTLSFCFSANADGRRQDVLDALKGRYQASVDGHVANFVIRSRGVVEKLNEEDWRTDFKLVELRSESDVWFTGLSVYDLILSYGSDEDVTDVHILMTATQSGDDEAEIKVIHVFSTFNDGPNDTSSVSQRVQLKLSKYDASIHSMKRIY